MRKEFLDTYTDREQYDIVVACRGFDTSPGNATKDYVTWPLRAIVFDHCASAKFEEEWLPDIEEALRTLKDVPGFAHWRSHLIDAVSASKDDPVWNGHAGALLAVLDRVS